MVALMTLTSSSEKSDSDSTSIISSSADSPLFSSSNSNSNSHSEDSSSAPFLISKSSSEFCDRQSEEQWVLVDLRYWLDSDLMRLTCSSCLSATASRSAFVTAEGFDLSIVRILASL